MSEITRDIDDFNEHKLRLWVSDSMERYKMADLSDHQAVASMLSTFMYVFAQAVALTEFPATEVGDRLVHAIDAIREHKRGQKKKYRGKIP